MTADRTTVEKILSEAQGAVEGAGISDELREVAFGKAVDMLGGTVVPAATAAASEQVDTGGGGGDDLLAKIAKKLGVDAKTADFFFDSDADDVTLVVPRSKLNPKKSDATREVTLLYCAARQAGAYDATHTSVENIKTRVENMGVLDSSNFSTHLKNIEGLSVRGSGQSREFKVTSHGYEQAAKMMNRIKGGGS
ncbi:MAG: hypothetical protein M3R37_14325 [Actinomycetota bacterium]|nr:hypothetical protein [Actinomycetota bacterium]